MINLSNPRTEATIEDWPSGRKRVTARFYVETKPKFGQRMARVTTGKPKTTTYYQRIVLCDGDDGKTYLLALCSIGIVRMLATMKYTDYFYPENEEFEQYRQLLLTEEERQAA